MARREEAKEMWPAWVKVERAKWGRSEAVSCNKRQFGMPVAGWEDPFPHNQTLQPHHFPVPFWSLFLPFHTMPYLSRVDLGVWPWNASISVAYQTDHMTYGASCAKNSQPLFCIRLAIWILIQVSLPPTPPTLSQTVPPRNLHSNGKYEGMDANELILRLRKFCLMTARRRNGGGRSKPHGLMNCISSRGSQPA